MKKTFLSETTKPRAVVFDMQYKKVVYSNYIHGAKNTPPLGVTCFVLRRLVNRNVKNLLVSNHRA